MKKIIKKQILKSLYKNKVILLVLAFSVLAGLYNPKFFTWDNFISTIVETNAYWGILSIGMTFVILTGGIDLSIGSMLALVGFASTTLIKAGHPVLLSFGVGILFGILLGFLQGSFIGLAKLPAFIITLVGMLIFRGAVRLWANGYPVTVDNPFLFKMAVERFLGIPIHAWVLIITAIIAWYILRHTKLGRHIYATGSNQEASRLSGIKTSKVIIFAYVFMGIMVALSSSLFISSLQSVEPNAGTGFELNAIAAVVLGGTSLEGGKGGVGKTIIGWLVISILGNALIFMGFNSDWQTIFKGIVILITIIFDKDIKLLSRFKKTNQN